jgi:5-formyltetrahydrofolate cyclo-ligase
MEAKTSRRRVVSAGRAARSAAEREQAGDALAELAVRHWAGVTAVAAYVSVGDEPPTWQLLERLLERGVRLLLPIVDGRALEWAEYAGPEQLVPSAYGLLEPTTPRVGHDALREVDVVLVPALCVDRGGVRLGKGGGYYDRTLGELPPTPMRPPLVAVVYDDEVVDDLPVEPHDVPVDAALTPSGLQRLGRDPA